MPIESPESTPKISERVPCPRCHSTQTRSARLLGLQTHEWGTDLRRLRKCLNCGHTFTTVEHTEVGTE